MVADPISSAECIRDVIQATNEHQRAEEDLGAQTDMALWAFGMLVITAVMAVISGVGVVFIWKTLKATQEMALDAARATDATVAAVSVPNRAWITTDLEKVAYRRESDGSIDFHVEVRVTNVGKTPSLNTHTMIQAIIGYNSAPQALAEMAKNARVRDTRNGRITFPNQSYIREWGPYLGNIDIYQASVPAVVIIGVVTYETLFSAEIHQTGFAFGIEFPGNSIIPGSPGEEGDCSAFVVSGGFAD